MGRLPEGVRRAFRMRRRLRSQVADEVDAELRFHLESRIEELVGEGLERREAERRALAEFGDVERARRALVHESARTERRARLVDWLTDLVQDVRFGWRKLWSRPGFAAVAILTLALGIGANTAIFSVVYAVLLRPLPYAEADRLVQVWETAPDGDDHNVVSSGNYLDWRERANSFEALGAYGWTFGVGLMGDDGEPVQTVGTTMTPSVFRMLGVAPLLGRTFTPEEGERGQVVILSHGLWERHFGADPGVIDRRLSLDDTPYTVVGVMSPEFDFPRPNIDFWLPRQFDESDREVRRSHQWRVIGRLAEGVSIERAQAEMDGIAAQLAEEHPQFMQGWGVNVLPFRSDLVGNVRPLLVLLFSVVVVVLLIACVNLANLLLARAMAREREVAVRGALGAGRGRLIRQFLAESLLVATLGGGLGVVIIAVGLDSLVALAPADIPLLNDTRIDPAVLGFAAGATLLAVLFFGLIPALRITATNLGASLRSSHERAGDVRHARLRSGLLVAEVALTTVLLVGAGLLLRSFVRLQNTDLGFNSENVLTVMLDVPRSRYGETAEQVEFYRRLIERAEALPGVISAAGTAEPPVIGYNNTFSFAIEGRPSGDPDGREDPVPLRAVTPGFFRTMGIPLVRGRAIDERDRPGSPPVIVINASLARRHWSDQDPIGRRVSFQGPEGPTWWEIVGVVGDTRHFGADRPPVSALYIAQAQKPWDWMSWLTVVARTEDDPLALAPAFRAALWEIDDRIPVERLTTMEEVYAESNAQRRFAATLAGGFAALALVLGVIGIYGVLSYTVARRTREIGVRIALGAQRSAVAGSVVRQGLVLAVAGLTIGLAIAFLLSRFLESLVYGITTTDTATFVGVPTLLVTVAVLAAYLPARRATRIDPMQALRTE